jgi:hypothetical protein
MDSDNDKSILDKPITGRGLMHCALFICFFPFSMLVYFPLTSLVIGVATLAWALLIVARIS